jgi:hypothetical protein
MRSPTLPDWIVLDNRFGTNDSELEREMGVGVSELLGVGHRQLIDRHRKIIIERRSTDRRLESHILYTIFTSKISIRFKFRILINELVSSCGNKHTYTNSHFDSDSDINVRILHNGSTRTKHLP